MPDDHSELVPLLPIPNRTVKRLSADDSAGSRVKVGHRQALTAQTAQPLKRLGVLLLRLRFCVSTPAGAVAGIPAGGLPLHADGACLAPGR